MDMQHTGTEMTEAEQVHFTNVVTTFQNYGPYALAANSRRRKDLFALSKGDQDLLSSLGYKEKLEQVDAAIMANTDFLKQIVANPEIFGVIPEPDEDGGEGHGDQEPTSPPLADRHKHDHVHSHSHGHGSHSHSHDAPASAPGRKRRRYKPTEFDMDKLRSTLKQFGKEERELSYEPMKAALIEHFSDIPPEERRNFRVLVPGAGLGRLAYDVAKLGFACQGNEFSHYMLLASYYMLNKTEKIGQHTIYPYVHSFSNLRDRASLLRPIPIPDVLPSDLPPDSGFSYVAGDFEEIFGDTESEQSEPQAGQWDAVLTCFFIDTAKNIVNYLRIIHRLLAPGGVWINLGPLLWHWENNTTNDPSIELDLEEVKTLARAIGFDISNEQTIDTTYTNNPHAMLGYTYHAALWTATKRI
ncbi:N2227-like protein-domain-containing protein [Schizophyllum amplum]|uniref:carnosine N-methyltransferase n=1 Tax=Schizophyllum amplum TaxID=97359 RepID=A0A550CQS8_9AGAR|nr:N2227-like protein-domain-containing protein [Auriculariopsis ampla]